jgi:hypothetical protein
MNRVGASSMVLAMILLSGSIAFAAPGDTTRVSVDSSGVQGNALSGAFSISADGRYVGFRSEASNLVSGDTNGFQDVFVRDRQTGTTTRVSVDSSGVEGNWMSDDPLISADGRYVAFSSEASNLVSGDTNDYKDVFVHDRLTGITTRVSVDSNGVEGNEMSVAHSISADGRFVVFESDATNLVVGDTNGCTDIFVHDRVTGATTLVSVDSSGVQGIGPSWHASISADGRYVAFHSEAGNLVSGDTNGYADVFVRDLVAGTTTRVSVNSSGGQASPNSLAPSISADGRYVAFESDAGNLVIGDANVHRDIFVHDRATGATTLVSVDSSGVQGDLGSSGALISADGRYVIFHSRATTLVSEGGNGSNHVFRHDRLTGITTRVSVDSTGVQGDGDSGARAISADGRYVSFSSLAGNLVSGDTNGCSDAFVHEMAVSVPPAHVFQLPDTDQQTCLQLTDPYAVIPCAGTGQDGAYRNGPLSYTDNGNGTVTDANTGLVWQQGEPGTKSWAAAITDCDGLDLGGQTDWRLPSRKELLSIYDFNIGADPRYNPTFFPDAVANNYWTATEYAGDTSEAWCVGDGKSDHGNKADNQPNVRCVRGAVNDAAAFTDNADGTVTDGRTALVWQQGNPAARAQGDALTYCEGLEFNGQTDWRLPNAKELETLVDTALYSPAIDPAFFPDAAVRYWSSTAGRYVDFVEGTLDGFMPSSNYGVRCVRGGPTGPFAVDDLTRARVGFPVVIHPLGNDLAPAGGTLAITWVTQGANGGVITDGTTATYTPNPAFEGFDWFTYTIEDGLGGNDTATVTVKVTTTPDNYPVAVDDTATTNMVQQVSIAVLDNDTDADGDPLTVSEVTQGANGAVTTDGTNAIYTPGAGFFGIDSFTYTVDDGFGGTDVGTVTVTVNHNYAPVVVEDAATTGMNVPVVITVLANDTDADGNTLTVTDVWDMDHGTANTDGTTLTYTPDQGFTGTDSFQYSVSDGAGGTGWAVVTVTVTVSDVNRPPVLDPVGNRTVEEGVALVIVLGAGDPDTGATLTFSASNLPDGATWDAGTATFTWTPGYNQAGTWPGVRFEVSDGELTDSEEITITVTDHDPLLFADDFSDGTATGDPDWLKVNGTWKTVLPASGNRYFASLNKSKTATALVDGFDFRDGRVQTRFKIGASALNPITRLPYARTVFVVFDRVDAGHYRAVKVGQLKSGKWKLSLLQTGDYDGDVKGTKDWATLAGFKVKAWHTLTIDIHDSNLTRVFLDGTLAAEYDFGGFTGGKVGLLTKSTAGFFDDFQVYDGTILLPE